MSKLMLGNQAVARALYESGVKVVSSYPGTPSTEITEFASAYAKNEIYCEWAPNEKVACETAIGASIAGARSFCAMKHVGLNVAADPLYTASYTGVNGGLVVAVADDPGMHSSQNEQDSRNHAIGSKLPMLEPSDSAECKEFTKLAYEISEEFDVPVLLRLSTRVSHSQSKVEEEPRADIPNKPYEKNPQKYVMMPAFAKPKHLVVEKRTERLIEYAEASPLNRVELNDSAEIGVITSGVSYQYAKEALGKKASYLKLGMVNPLPEKLIKDFAAKVKTLYIIEELDPIIENHVRKLGIHCIGKERFTLLGEYSQSLLREKILGEKTEALSFGEAVPIRPPVMCAGCPHRGLFYVLKKLGCLVSGDIGCYTLGAAAPLQAMDTTVCMGASVSGLHGINKADPDFAKNSVAVIGDSTFIHSGITGLINIAYNRSNSTVIILDNSITGMTGHQNNPANGKNIYGDPANAVNLEALCKSIGINRVRTVDPYDMPQAEAAVKEELAMDEPSVIISRRPCALLKTVVHKSPLKVNSDKCVGCKQCLKIGCPALYIREGKSVIDRTQCVGCGICKDMCRPGAITD